MMSGTGVNVAGKVPGTAPGGRVLVVGAHYDHIGRNAGLSRDAGIPGLRPGADDNASGTAALLELARRIAARPLPVTVVFVAFDAEELGLPTAPDPPLLAANQMLGPSQSATDYRAYAIPATLEPGWHTVCLRVTEQPGSLDVRASVRVIGPRTRVGLVSDLDDTVIVTMLPQPLVAFRNAFLLRESARTPVPGMAPASPFTSRFRRVWCAFTVTVPADFGADEQIWWTLRRPGESPVRSPGDFFTARMAGESPMMRSTPRRENTDCCMTISWGVPS